MQILRQNQLAYVSEHFPTVKCFCIHIKRLGQRLVRCDFAPSPIAQHTMYRSDDYV